MVRLLVALALLCLIMALLIWSVAGLLRIGRETGDGLTRAVTGGSYMQNIAFALLVALIVYVSFFGGA